jgi:chromosome segregation protein
MFLKTLTLKGFKSFAEATTLEFEPGTTVVVGPNGSGKSNVVDAIGWVLGSQAPSAVRSQKMDDVIFAGSGSRPALGRAEVALTVDNSAGLLPIGFTEVTITRTLFRGGESEYAINGVNCRLLDVQELLSDTGVGRQQHVIVSQGQIDAVLNARPEDRRLIIEEAAGVLKYRRRKERAERRLAATEANLLRLQDLLREVRRQLRPLERQADAARRHGDLVAELTALRLHLAGRELASLRGRLAQKAGTRSDLATAETELRRLLAELDTELLGAEAELTALGDRDLGEVLGRFESMRERARGLAALTAERSRGVERERERMVDGALVTGLEAEADVLHAQLSTADAEALDLGRVRAMVVDELSWLEAERNGPDAPDGDDDGDRHDAATQAAEARGERHGLGAAIERAAAALDDDRHRLVRLEAKQTHLRLELDDTRRALADGEPATAAEAEAEAAARASLAKAEAEVADAAAALRTAEAEHHRWAARADALAEALDAARARSGAQRLADLGGVVGTLVDLVEVDAGFEAAFEAAVADALAAVVVDSVDTARRAMDSLRRGDVGGALLPVPAAGQSSAAGHRGLRPHVRSSRADVERLLDALLASVVLAADLDDALHQLASRPAAVVVTRDGDRLAPSGWRVGGTAVGATAAAVEEARARAGAAKQTAVESRRRVAAAESTVADHRRAAGQATERLAAHHHRLEAAKATLDRLERSDDELADDITAYRDRIRERSDGLAADRDRLAELEHRLRSLEADEAAEAERVQAEQAAKHRLAQDLAATAARRADLDVRIATVDERRTQIRHRLDEIDGRLAGLGRERAAAADHRRRHEVAATVLARLSRVLDTGMARIDGELAELRDRRQHQTAAARAVAERLDDLRRRRSAAEAELEATRERSRRAELDEAETRLRLEQAVERCRHDLDVEPERAETAPCPPLPDGVPAPARLRELERELRLMGPVNPLAVEEHRALEERHEFLTSQLDDVKDSRRELGKIIRTVDEEIVNAFAAAYADVSENFTNLFETLFPGGRGRLGLTEPDNLLETGIDVEARPSGKNVKKLSLLSGGERSLTALAFLFAVFRSRPSPFYVLDEVEAALDDVNLHRFLDLVAEFRREAQLLVVSHQKRTMEAADCLYGVTMQPGGSSRVISEKISVVA